LVFKGAGFTIRLRRSRNRAASLEGLLFGFQRRQALQLQMSLHQFPQLLPVLILHMHEFNAIPFWPNIPHDRRKMNLT
jgi:hypothetical protein